MPTLERLTPNAPAHERRSAAFEPTSFNPADNSIELVWTTGAAVMRYDWLDGEYYHEELSTAPNAVRLQRLNSGAPFLDSHIKGSLAAVIGSVVPGSARMENGLGLCRVRLAETPDVADTVAKIKAGHIRNVSVGYAVFEFERTETRGQHATMRAIDWEPQEISAVTVPADPGAQIRLESKMPVDNQNTRSRPVSLTRIVELCQRASLSAEAENSILRQHAETPLSEAQLADAITDAYVDQQPQARINNTVTRNSDSLMQLHEVERLQTRMSGAIGARLRNSAPAPESAEFMGTSMIDMARGLMMARGERVQFLSPGAIYERAGSMTTSDFALLLGVPLNSYLNELFRTAPPALQSLARPRKVRDFRPVSGLNLEGAGGLDFVAENGEYSYGAFSESGQSYSVKTFGKIFAMSRQLIVNDSLGLYTQGAAIFVRAAARKRAEFLSAIVSSNATIDSISGSDVPIFDAGHGNLAVSGGAITVATLSAGRLAMRGQKDAEGNIYDVIPKYLVVGPQKETEGEAALTQLNAASQNDVNPFSGKLELKVEPRLPGNAWYLFGDPTSFPVLEYATLEGTDDVFVDTRQRWSNDGIETKVRIDFGAAAIDYRGAYKNPGN